MTLAFSFVNEFRGASPNLASHATASELSTPRPASTIPSGASFKSHAPFAQLVFWIRWNSSSMALKALVPFHLTFMIPGFSTHPLLRFACLVVGKIKKHISQMVFFSWWFTNFPKQTQAQMVFFFSPSITHSEWTLKDVLGGRGVDFLQEFVP